MQFCRYKQILSRKILPSCAWYFLIQRRSWWSPLKCWYLSSHLHCITSQNTVFLTLVVRILNLLQWRQEFREAICWSLQRSQ
jgi:hypothetical protein